MDKLDKTPNRGDKNKKTGNFYRGFLNLFTRRGRRNDPEDKPNAGAGPNQGPPASSSNQYYAIQSQDERSTKSTKSTSRRTHSYQNSSTTAEPFKPAQPTFSIDSEAAPTTVPASVTVGPANVISPDDFSYLADTEPEVYVLTPHGEVRLSFPIQMGRHVSTLQLPNAPNEPPCVRSLPSDRTVQRRKERMPPYCQIILTPMFAAMSPITNRLFLTGVGGMTKENFVRNRINFVINATLEAPNLCMNGVKTLRIPVDDTPEDDIYLYFVSVADHIARHLEQKKGNIVVHCVAGVSRSTSLVLAYLIKHKRMSLHQAYNHVHIRRPVIRPNNGFFKQLIEFEKRIFGRASVEIVETIEEGVRIQVPDFFLQEHRGFIVLEAMKERAKQDPSKQLTGSEPPVICQAVGGTNEEAAGKMDATLKQNVLEQYVLGQGPKRTTASSSNQLSTPTTDKALEAKENRRRRKNREKTQPAKLKSKEIKTSLVFAATDAGSGGGETTSAESVEIKQTNKKHRAKVKIKSEEPKESKEIKEEGRDEGKETPKRETSDQAAKPKRKGTLQAEIVKKEDQLPKETMVRKEEDRPERSKKVSKSVLTKRKKVEETTPEATVAIEPPTVDVVRPEQEKAADIVREEPIKKLLSYEDEPKSKKEYKRKRKKERGGGGPTTKPLPSPPPDADSNKKEKKQ